MNSIHILLAPLMTIGWGFLTLMILVVMCLFCILLLRSGTSAGLRVSQLLLPRILGIAAFIFLAALTIETARHTTKDPSFLSYLVVFIPFFMFCSVSAKENMRTAREAMQGSNSAFEQSTREIQAAILNGSGSGFIAFFVFAFTDSIHNWLFFNIPYKLVSIVQSLL